MVCRELLGKKSVRGVLGVRFGQRKKYNKINKK